MRRAVALALAADASAALMIALVCWHLFDLFWLGLAWSAIVLLVAAGMAVLLDWLVPLPYE